MAIRFSANRKELIKALSVTKKHRGKRPFVTIQSRIGQLAIIAYGGPTDEHGRELESTTVKISVRGGGEDGEVTLASQKLERYLKALEAEVVHFEPAGGDPSDGEMVVHDAAHRFLIDGYIGLNEETLLQDVAFAVKMTKSKWLESIRKVEHAASNMFDFAHYRFAKIHIEAQDGTAIFVATNGRVMATYQQLADIKGDKRAVAIPITHIEAIKYQLGKFGETAVIELKADALGRYHFESEGEILLSGSGTEALPTDWRGPFGVRQFASTTAKMQIDFDREELLNAIKDLQIMRKVGAVQNEEPVTIRHTGFGAFLQDFSLAYSRPLENIKYSGTMPFKWMLNLEYLIKILESVDSKRVMASKFISTGSKYRYRGEVDVLAENGYPILFTNNLAWKTLLMPMHYSEGGK